MQLLVPSKQTPRCVHEPSPRKRTLRKLHDTDRQILSSVRGWPTKGLVYAGSLYKSCWCYMTVVALSEHSIQCLSSSFLRSVFVPFPLSVQQSGRSLALAHP